MDPEEQKEYACHRTKWLERIRSRRNHLSNQLRELKFELAILTVIGGETDGSVRGFSPDHLLTCGAQQLENQYHQRRTTDHKAASSNQLDSTAEHGGGGALPSGPHAAFHGTSCN